jgi:hypothetical protein
MKWLLLVVSLNSAEIMERYDIETDCTVAQRQLNTMFGSHGLVWHYCVPFIRS